MGISSSTSVTICPLKASSLLLDDPRHDTYSDTRQRLPGETAISPFSSSSTGQFAIASSTRRKRRFGQPAKVHAYCYPQADTSAKDSMTLGSMRFSWQCPCPGKERSLNMSAVYIAITMESVK